MRILGEVTKEAADVLRLTDHIFIEELRKSDWYYKTSQAFAVYLPSSPSVSPVTVAVTRR